MIFHQDLIENKPSLVQEHIGRVDSALCFLGGHIGSFFLNHVFDKYFCLFVCLFFFILTFKRIKRNVAMFNMFPAFADLVV